MDIKTNGYTITLSKEELDTIYCLLSVVTPNDLKDFDVDDEMIMDMIGKIKNFLGR